jgi:predicted PurR-regulated permease PerM
LVFLSLIFWGWVFGPIGMVLSVPLTMTIKIALSNFEQTKWVSTLMDDPNINFSGIK